MAADDATLSEVVVTARRVPEKASSLPLSIDVASTSLLGAGGVDGMESLANHFPGLSYESLWGGFGAAPKLRGQSQPSTAGDNVGVFVDDVYQAGRALVDIDPLDIDRIEVVRGPQNTLFGRSTFSGAIRYVSSQPTAQPDGSLRLELGSDALAAATGHWSQRIGNSGWLGRLAAGLRRSDGTRQSIEGENLGGSRRRTVALSIARDAGEFDTSVALNLRLGDSRSGHPASITLDANDYNCGALDTASGYWSYFCGRMPVDAPVSLTPGLPDSLSRSAQGGLRIENSTGRTRLLSLTTYYHSSATAYRDFDGSAQGFWTGVCTVNVNCTVGPVSVPVTRFAFPNTVSRLDQVTTDWSQELRIGSADTGALQWMLGLAGAWTELRDMSAMGADRGNLLTTERLTSIVAAAPNRTGPQSALNRALVTDSRVQQLAQTDTRYRQTTIGVFGMIDMRISARSHARVELRTEREVQHVDPVLAGALPITDPDPEPVSDWETTPRFSLDIRADEHWYGYASLARGARSGGVNTIPGLDAEERTYEPEYNWTTELGLRYTGTSLLKAVRATAYHIDWRNAQILGLATTPGIGQLITRNTAGITTQGIETLLELRIGGWMTGAFAYSLADSSFRSGSDDPGSRTFCGLSAQPPGSDFCAFGPPRSGTAGSLALVPYLDGNRLARAPRNSWNLSLQLNPLPLGGGWRLSAMSWKGEGESGS